MFIGDQNNVKKKEKTFQWRNFWRNFEQIIFELFYTL